MGKNKTARLCRRCGRFSRRWCLHSSATFECGDKNEKANRPNANFLSKPFHLKDLVLKVERLFAKESFGELK
jgi:hypothetical protein